MSDFFLNYVFPWVALAMVVIVVGGFATAILIGVILPAIKVRRIASRLGLEYRGITGDSGTRLAHSFCQSCLHMGADNSDQIILYCPKCREKVAISEP